MLGIRKFGERRNGGAVHRGNEFRGVGRRAFDQIDAKPDSRTCSRRRMPARITESGTSPCSVQSMARVAKFMKSSGSSRGLEYRDATMNTRTDVGAERMSSGRDDGIAGSYEAAPPISTGTLAAATRLGNCRSRISPDGCTVVDNSSAAHLARRTASGRSSIGVCR